MQSDGSQKLNLYLNKHTYSDSMEKAETNNNQ